MNCVHFIASQKLKYQFRSARVPSNSYAIISLATNDSGLVPPLDENFIEDRTGTINALIGMGFRFRNQMEMM